jgi:hypothetical protein
MEKSFDFSGYRPNPEVMVRRMGQEMILLHLGTNRFYELNGTAARFWELLNAAPEPGQIPQQLLQEFEVEEAQLLTDLQALCAALLAENLLVCVQVPDGAPGNAPRPNPDLERSRRQLEE